MKKKAIMCALRYVFFLTKELMLLKTRFQRLWPQTAEHYDVRWKLWAFHVTAFDIGNFVIDDVHLRSVTKNFLFVGLARTSLFQGTGSRNQHRSPPLLSTR